MSLCYICTASQLYPNEMKLRRSLTSFQFQQLPSCSLSIPSLLPFLQITLSYHSYYISPFHFSILLSFIFPSLPSLLLFLPFLVFHISITPIITPMSKQLLPQQNQDRFCVRWKLSLSSGVWFTINQHFNLESNQQYYWQFAFLPIYRTPTGDHSHRKTVSALLQNWMSHRHQVSGLRLISISMTISCFL